MVGEELCGWLKLFGGISKKLGYSAQTQILDEGVVVAVAIRTVNMFEGVIQRSWADRRDLDSDPCASLAK